MMMRGGTSKGAYFLASDLPADARERDALPISAALCPTLSAQVIDQHMAHGGGRDAEDFETIARRYVDEDPAARRTFTNKLRAILNMMKTMLTPAPDLDRYEREMGFPAFRDMELSPKSEEWCEAHVV